MTVFSNFNAGQWVATCLTSVCILLATTLCGVYKVKKRIEKNLAAALAKIRELEQQSADNKKQEAQSFTKTNNEIDRQKKEIVELHKENEKLKADLEFMEAAIKANQDDGCGSSD